MNNVDYSGILLSVGILLAILIPIITRKLLIWWLGINEVIEQQKETNALFRQYLETQGLRTEKTPSPPTVAPQAPQKQAKSPYSLTNQ